MGTTRSKWLRRTIAALAVWSLSCLPRDAQAESADVSLGRQIEDFTLTDYLGARRSLSDWSDQDAVVVVFLGTECPLAKLYAGRLAQFDADFTDRGVQWIGINSNQQDTLQEIAVYAKKHSVEFPILKDPGAKIAQQFGATRTPEAFLLDGQRVVRYQGRIDDQYGVGTARGEPTRSELRDALEAVLAGKPVARPNAPAVGCLIGRRPDVSPADGATHSVTYSRQISRLMQKHCVSCHREGQIAPFTLTDHQDVAAWAETMMEVIDDGRMPPWHANPKHGQFYNDSRMEPEEKELFRDWIDAGCPEGDRAELPEPLSFAGGWGIPEPDAVFRMPEEFQVPASGTVPYQHFFIDPGFTEDKWVYAAEARPGNRAVVHHLIMFYLPPGQERHRPEDPLFNAVAAFAPGLPAIQGPKRYAVRIPAGSRLGFQVHYTPNGSPQIDRSEAGICFADFDEVEKEVRVQAAFNFRFLIPPGDPDYEVRQQYRFGEDTLLYGLTPHMHYRGKSFRFTANYPDGASEILLDVPRYDFNWQNIYLLEQPKKLPEGTMLDLEAHFDNSAANPLNPDPAKAVYWGDQTWEEMMLGSFTVSKAEQDLTLGPPRIEPIEHNGKDDPAFRVTFRYPAPINPPTDIEAVYLAGSFNDWNPVGQKMEGPDDGGFYTATIDLPAGRYEYKFVINGDRWKSDPGNAESVGYYGNSVLNVP